MKMSGHHVMRSLELIECWASGGQRTPAWEVYIEARADEVRRYINLLTFWGRVAEENHTRAQAIEARLNRAMEG